MAEPQVSIWIRARDAASGVFKRVERNLLSFARLGLSVGRDLAAIGAGTAAAIAGLTKLGQRGADVAGVQRAFNRVTGDGAVALKQLQAATGGVVSSFDLMSNFNKAVSRGTVRSVQEFGELSRVATTLSDVIGVDDTQAFEMLAEAMGKGNARGLASLGIMVDQKAAHEEYARVLGKSVTELTELEKKEAVRRAGMREGIRLAEEMSGGELGAADAANRFATQVSDLKDQIALLVATAPSVSAFFDVMRDGLRMLGGEDMEMPAIEASVANIPEEDLRLHLIKARAKRDQLFAQMAATPEADRTVRAIGEHGVSEFEAEPFRKLREDAAFEDKRVAAISRRLNAGSKPLGVDPPGPSGGSSDPGAFLATRENLQALLDKLAEAQVTFRSTQLDHAIAPSEESLKKLQEAEESLRRIYAALAQVGGVGAARDQLALDGILNAAIPKRDLSDQIDIGIPGRRNAYGRELTIPERAPATMASLQAHRAIELAAQEKAAKDAADATADVTREMEDFAPVAIASFGAMAQAAIQGSEITAQSVIGMFSNILANMPGVGSLASSVIGVVGGLVGGLVGRDRGPTKVSIDSVSPSAARTMAEAAEARPLRITNVIESGGREIARTEYELRRRQRRDAVPRYVGGS